MKFFIDFMLFYSFSDNLRATIIKDCVKNIKLHKIYEKSYFKKVSLTFLFLKH